MKINVIKNKSGLIEIKSEWQNLSSEPSNTSIFTTFKCVSAWWKYFGEGQLFVVTVRDGRDNLVGVAPLRKKIHKVRGIVPIKKIEFLGLGEYDRLDFVVANKNKKKIISKILMYLFEEKTEWDLLNFSEVSKNSLLSNILSSKLKDHNFDFECSEKNVCPYINLNSSWEGYLNFLTSKDRINFEGLPRKPHDQKKFFQKRLRKAQKDFIFKFDVIKKGGEVKTAIEKLYYLHQKRWDYENKEGSFSETDFAQLHKELMGSFSHKGRLRLYRLKLDDTVAAIMYAIRYKNTIYYYQSGWNPKFSKYSPGVILVGCSIRSAIEEKGVDKFDFLRGNEMYKYDWASDRIKHLGIQIYNNNVKTKVYHYFKKLRQSYIK